MIIGVGVDVVEIERLRRVLESQGERFLRRVFTQNERDYCEARRDSAPHYAVRFAAKEAALKALGTGWSMGIRWQDVEVMRKEPGAPSLVLHGQAERRCLELGGTRVHVSLSHSRRSAVALVVLEG